MTASVERAIPDDMAEIWALLKSRPIDNFDTWQPPLQCEWYVARVEGRIEALLVGRIDPAGYVWVENLEARYADGNPTPGALIGMAALEDALHTYADACDMDVLGTTTLTNFRHMDALDGRGYELAALVWRRPAHAKRKRLSERGKHRMKIHALQAPVVA